MVAHLVGGPWHDGIIEVDDSCVRVSLKIWQRGDKHLSVIPRATFETPRDLIVEYRDTNFRTLVAGCLRRVFVYCE